MLKNITILLCLVALNGCAITGAIFNTTQYKYDSFVSGNCQNQFENPIYDANGLLIKSLSGDDNCSSDLQSIIQNPDQLQKLITHSLQQNMSPDDPAPVNITQILQAGVTSLSNDEARLAIEKLSLNPFSDDNFSTSFWQSAKDGNWNISWILDDCKQFEVTNHCDDFTQLVLNNLTDKDKKSWALSYYDSWKNSADSSECFIEAINIAMPYLKKQILEELKLGYDQSAISDIQSFGSHENDPELLDMLGIADMGNGDLNDALVNFGSALDLDPSNSLYKKQLDNARNKQRKEFDEQQTYQQENRDSLIDDSEDKIKHKKYQLAIDEIKNTDSNAGDINSDPDILKLLGIAYYGIQDFDNSVSSFQSALSIDTDNQEIKNWLHKAQTKLNEANQNKPCSFPGSPMCASICQEFTNAINNTSDTAQQNLLEQQYAQALAQDGCYGAFMQSQQ